MSEQSRPEPSLTPFHRQESIIDGAESLSLNLGAAKVVVETDPQATQPKYVVSLLSDIPLDDSKKQRYIAENGISAKQNGASWHLSDAAQTSPTESSSPARIRREVRLTLPPDNGEVHIALQRGSVNLTGNLGSVTCELATGDITVLGCTGSITTRQDVGNIMIQGGRGTLRTSTGIGTCSINGFTGRVSADISGTGSLEASDLTLTEDSEIITDRGSQVVKIISSSPDTIITTTENNKPVIYPTYKLLPNGSIVRSDADPGTIQLAENPEQGEVANFIAEKAHTQPHICVLQITGPGKVIVGQLIPTDPLNTMAVIGKRLLALVPNLN